MFPSSFVVSAYIQVRLTPQDCLPDRQVKGTTGALHLALFEQPEKNNSFSKLLDFQGILVGKPLSLVTLGETAGMLEKLYSTTF